MSCPKNIKTWWKFKWEGPHDWFITHFADETHGNWTKHEKCTLCKCHIESTFGIDEEGMVRAGYNIDDREYKSSLSPSYYPYELGVGTKDSYNKEYNKLFNKGK